MTKQILWSNFEISPYIEKEAKNLGIDLNILSEDALCQLIKEYSVSNNNVLEQTVKPYLDKIFNRPLYAIAVIQDEKHQKVGQTAKYIGKNLKNIFDIPYEYGTWYYDSWDLCATIVYNGLYYHYTFRELRQGKNGEVFVNNIEFNRKFLTPTYMGTYTQTVLLHKRRRKVGGV